MICRAVHGAGGRGALWALLLFPTLVYALWACVFLPDHGHLVVRPKDRQYDDSDYLKAAKDPVSRRAVQFLRRESPAWLKKIRVRRGTKVEHHFWQPGRGHDRNIITSRTLLRMIDYIHQNPIRRSPVEQARDGKWSSAATHATIEPARSRAALRRVISGPDGFTMNDLKPDPIPWDWLEDAPPEA